MALGRLKKALKESLIVSYETRYRAEHEKCPFYDVQDQDVVGYIQEFLQSVAPTRLSGYGASVTREEALKALNWIERARPSNSPQARTARALRELINNQNEIVAEQH